MIDVTTSISYIHYTHTHTHTQTQITLYIRIYIYHPKGVILYLSSKGGDLYTYIYVYIYYVMLLYLIEQQELCYFIKQQELWYLIMLCCFIKLNSRLRVKAGLCVCVCLMNIYDIRVVASIIQRYIHIHHTSPPFRGQKQRGEAESD